MFGCLRQSVFANKFLSVDAHRCVYLATVVATLLYGSETRAVKARQVWRLEVVHNYCCAKGNFGSYQTSAMEISCFFLGFDYAIWYA